MKGGRKMQFNAILEKDEYGYFAYVPALKGCVSQGDTFEEALENIKEAIGLYIEELEEAEISLAMNKNFIIAPIEVDVLNA
jgi:predicted RNase H-like HicB family nuclease